MIKGRVIHPPRDQLDRLRTPLTDGEREVLELFDELLAPEWEIYLQPHLNGLRPDFVLLNPQIGIGVFEVKDWNLTAMNYYVKDIKPSGAALWATKDGQSFSVQRQNPIDAAYRYRNEIYNLYCPRLKQKSGYGALSAGVIFTRSSESDVKPLMRRYLVKNRFSVTPNFDPISGSESLMKKDLKSIFPMAFFGDEGRSMSEELANDFRTWLIEPVFSSEQREPLILDKNQEALAFSRTKSGYRRIKGSAGGGKSLVLAVRAVELAIAGKNVLVIAFNITMLNYLRDVTQRWKPNVERSGSITFLHYHGWVRRVLDGTDEGRVLSRSYAEDEEMDGAVIFEIMHSNAIEILKSGRGPEPFDAILVDEGQDIRPDWWNALRLNLSPDGEMLLFADATQDIYETNSSWTDEAMTGAGFAGGRWSELKTSYRIPEKLAPYARSFAEKFLSELPVNLPEVDQREIDYFKCDLRWIDVPESIAADRCLEEMLAFTSDPDGTSVSFADLTFLCHTHSFGEVVVGKLEALDIKVIHTFNKNDRESRRLKMGFFKGDARVKATTMHSFKGWESRALVIYIGTSADKSTLPLIYTAITRLKRSQEGSRLTVISSIPSLSEFGKTWPKYENWNDGAPF